MASAEGPLEGHLVAPAGAEVVTGSRGPLHADHGSFLDEIEDLDVQREGGALGLVRRGDDAVLVTAVRLRDEAEAARALSAFGTWAPDDDLFDATYDGLAEIVPDTVTRRMRMRASGGEGTLFEVARATDRDLVVFAQLDMSHTEVTPFTREVVDAHLAAFPAVTPPAEAGPHLQVWLLTASLALVVAIAAAGLVWLRKRRIRARKATPLPSVESQGGKVIW